MAERKIHIPHTYRGDFTILQQESDQAVVKAMAGLPLPPDDPIRAVIERRLQQFYIKTSSRFRKTVQYIKGGDNNVHRVIMEPDTNLQKINQIKCAMLRESVLKLQREKWPEVKISIPIEIPSSLQVYHGQDFSEDAMETVKRVRSDLPDHTSELRRIREIENLAAKTLKKIEAQEQAQKDFLK